jgi:hypothetical protein
METVVSAGIRALYPPAGPIAKPKLQVGWALARIRLGLSPLLAAQVALAGHFDFPQIH